MAQGAPADALVLRPMTLDDTAAVGALAQRQGRNASAQDYERFLALEGARGLVLTREGALLGAATVMRYFEHAFLGPVLLRDDEHTSPDGLAIALLAQLIEIMQRDGVGVLETEAAASEEPLLARMGFATLRRTIVLERAPGGMLEGAGSVPLEQRHFLDVGSLDATAVGYGRKQYILALARELPAAARVLEQDGEVVGFAMLRRAPRGFALGPIVTRDADPAAAGRLVRDALAAGVGERVVTLVPEGSALLATLEAEGFQAVGKLTRMRAGPRADAAGAATEWAIGSRLTG